ncbi:MAG: hypothetical protein V1655_03505 [bacterium]
MGNSECRQQPTQEKLEREEKTIQEIQKIQKFEFQNAQNLKTENHDIPSHIQEFLAVDLSQLNAVDLEAFRKFQEFLKIKDGIKSLDELKNMIEYFKDYKLKCDNVSQSKLTLARDMSAQGKSAGEIKVTLEEIKDCTGAPENSKFFMGYIVNRVNGEDVLLLDKLENK